MAKIYSTYPCAWCERMISNNGLARTSHFKACKVRLKAEAIRDERFRQGITAPFEEIIRLAKEALQ